MARRARTSPTSSCTRSPTAATRCRTRGAGYSPSVEDWLRGAGTARDRLRGRPLLRDGPRQALGAHRSGRTTCSCTARRRTTPSGEQAVRDGLRARRDGRVHRADDGRRARRAIRPGDSVIAFNFRPDRMREITRRWPSPASSERRPRRRATPRRALHDDDRVRGGLAVPGRVPAGAAGDRRSRTCSPSRRRARSCTSPRRRSTPTSRTSSTAARRSPYAGERRELVPSPRDVPTYDHKPEMSAREAAARVRARLARGRARASGSSTSPTPTWSATPA